MSEYKQHFLHSSASEDAPYGISRRSLLKSAIALSGATLFSATIATQIAEAAGKSPKSAVKYQDHPKGNKQCSKCVQFIPGKSPSAKGTCKVVKGDISPHGYCVAFAPKS